MNRVILMGRLTHDPELKQTNNGTSTTSFTVAVDRYSADGDGSADFIRCVAWKRQAEAIANYFGKGRMILVEGNIKTGSYEKDGHKVYTTDVWVDRFEFCGDKRDQAASVPVTDSIPAAAAANKPNAAQMFAERAKQGGVPVDTLDDFEEVISSGPLPF